MIGETLLNRYKIETELGKGGMGVVYKAHDALLERVVAIKFLNAGDIGTSGKTRLLAEARAAAKLNHPNIVSVFDAGEVGENPFIVMELVEGKTLREYTIPNLAEALNTAVAICKALQHAHAKGIVHRDLKLENVIVTDSQTIKLMDFGLARTSDQARLTEEGAVVGTFAYLAPELIQGEAATPQSDLYALGVILYELTTGTSPFNGTINEILAQHLHGNVRLPSEINPNIPAWVDEVILALLGKRPEERPASAHAVTLMLEKQTAASDPTFQYKVTYKTRNNLPAQITSFIGREKELQYVRGAIRENRLVTLTGVGGTGKTRLAVQAASTLLDDFSGGVWFVDLASVTNPELVAQTVASTLLLHELAERSTLEAVTEFLESRTVLLILDNCEHLIQAGAQFADHILHHCAAVKIIATSREPFSIAGESIWSVPSLSTPQRDEALTPTSVEQFEAVRLFAERARAVQPSFELNASNAKSVVQICARLDGIPLALELAAARVRSMSVEQIASRLDNRFRLLTGGSRTALPRQQTLGALVDWSYNLLSESERMVFQRLAVFIGSFSLEAAENVCAGNGIEEFDVLDLLQKLVDKSLVITEEHNNETYYRLLETIRQYGRDKLLASEDAEELANRHAQYFLKLAETADKELRGHNQLIWLHRLGVVLDNLRAALEWTLETELTETALQMVTKWDWFWHVRGDHTEGRRWLTTILKIPDIAAHPEKHSEVLSQLAQHVILQINPKEAKPFAEQAYGIALKHGDKHNMARALAMLGLALTYEDDFEATQSALRESMALFQQIPDEWGYAQALLCLAWGVYRQEDQLNALVYWEQALEIYRKLGDKYFESVILRGIGSLQMKSDGIEQGISALRASLTLAQQLNSLYEIAQTLYRFGEAMQISGHSVRAVRLYWAARNVFDSIGAWESDDDASFESAIAPCRAALDEETFKLAEEQGRALTIEQAIEYALEV